MLGVKRSLLVAVILSLALVVSGCQMEEPKTRKVLPEWSRGRYLGVAAVSQPVAMQVKDGNVHMVWVAAGGKSLYYARLDAQGRTTVETDLEIGGGHPGFAQLAIDGDGGVRVLWTDNPGIPRALFFVRLGPDGQLLSQPRQLTPIGVRVAGYDLAGSVDDSLDIFWATESPTDGGLYHLRLSKGDKVTSDSRLLVSGAEKPTLQVAPNGLIHLAWVQRPTLRENNVYYAVFDPLAGDLGISTHVGLYQTATGLVSYPPTLGLDSRTVYILWASEQRGGGLSPGEAQSFYVSFPLDGPRLNEPITVDIPGMARPEYGAASGSLPYEQLASVTAGWPTSFLYMPMALGGQREELGVVLAGEVATRNQADTEVVWVILADGQIKGYQLITRAHNVMRPTGVVDEDGNVHLSWLNTAGFGRYEVYYAATSETVKTNLDRVTLQDRAMDLLAALWTLVPAFGFFPPIFLLWSFASFVWVVGFYVVKVEGGLERRSARIALVIAILLYMFSKLFLMPGVLFTYAPFLDRLPEQLHIVSVLAAPLFTFLVGMVAVLIYFRRTEYRSLFVTYTILVVTDSLLSLIIYMPAWIGG